MISKVLSDISSNLQKNEELINKDWILRSKLKTITLSSIKIISIGSLPILILIWNNWWEMRLGYIITFLFMFPVWFILWIIDVYNKGQFEENSLKGILLNIHTLRQKLIEQVYIIEQETKQLHNKKNINSIFLISKKTEVFVDCFINYKNTYLKINNYYKKSFFSKNRYVYMSNQDTFIKNIYDLMRNNTIQLLEIQKELLIEQKKDINLLKGSDWKLTLDLQSKRLQWYIDSIEKVI